MPEKATFASTSQQPSINVRAATACDEVRRAAIAFKLPVPPTRECEELCVEVERAATASARSMNALRTAVERFTTALRHEGATPEEVLIVLKRVVNSRTFPSSAGSYNGEFGGEHIRQQISTWSIEEFFKEQE